MLDQDGHESLDRAENGSMNDDGTSEAGFDCLLLPNEIYIVKLVSLIQLSGHLLFGLLGLKLCGFLLFLGGILGLIL